MEIDKKIIIKLVQALEDLKKSLKDVGIESNDSAIQEEIDLSDKIIVKSDIYLLGKRTVFSHHEPQISSSFEDGKYVYTLNPLIDMNLSAEYRYNKKVSGFIQFNNFIGRKYQYWSNFPVQSINILGGVTFSF